MLLNSHKCTRSAAIAERHTPPRLTLGLARNKESDHLIV